MCRVTVCKSQWLEIFIPKKEFLETELFIVRWMDLESVIQNEVSQKEENKYCMLTDIYGI